MIYILPTDTCYGIACPLEDKKNYEKIYKIKKRSFEKPLAIMVENFDWLKKNTDLNDHQIDFLEKYKKPFTILTNSTPVWLFLQFGDEHEEHFINKDVYSRIAFRVANNKTESKLIKNIWPIWLTSANLSGTWEIYTMQDIEKVFSYYIEKGIIEVLADYSLSQDIPASDVFAFDGESLDLIYLRKN